MIRTKKTIAILLVVLFLVTVTAGAVSASHPILKKEFMTARAVNTAEHAGRKTVTLQSSILEQSKPILDLTSLQVGPMGPTPYPSISSSAALLPGYLGKKGDK